MRKIISVKNASIIGPIRGNRTTATIAPMKILPAQRQISQPKTTERKLRSFYLTNSFLSFSKSNFHATLLLYTPYGVVKQRSPLAHMVFIAVFTRVAQGTRRSCPTCLTSHLFFPQIRSFPQFQGHRSLQNSMCHMRRRPSLLFRR